MRYFTKKWYNSMQGVDYTFFKVDKNAETFSEDYFQKKFNQKKKFYASILQLVHRDFDEFIATNLESYKSKFPQEVFEEVADERLFALGYVSQNVYDKIKKYCEQNKRIIDDNIEEYNRIFNEQFGKSKPPFVSEFSFHDCDITYLEWNDEDLILTLDNSNGFTAIDKIIFKNAKIIKQEKKLEKLCWLYEEIYFVDNRYEIHILLCQDEELYDFILTCTDVEYNYG